jgi:hypothetical protein
MAGTTRLELATSAVTGQRSNQLNYVPTRHTVRAKPACLLSTLAVNRFACFNPFAPNTTSFRYEIDGMKDHQKPSAGKRDAKHLSMLCDEL